MHNMYQNRSIAIIYSGTDHFLERLQTSRARLAQVYVCRMVKTMADWIYEATQNSLLAKLQKWTTYTLSGKPLDENSSEKTAKNLVVVQDPGPVVNELVETAESATNETGPTSSDSVSSDKAKKSATRRLFGKRIISAITCVCLLLVLYERQDLFVDSSHLILPATWTKLKKQRQEKEALAANIDDLEDQQKTFLSYLSSLHYSAFRADRFENLPVPKDERDAACQQSNQRRAIYTRCLELEHRICTAQAKAGATSPRENLNERTANAVQRAILSPLGVWPDRFNPKNKTPEFEYDIGAQLRFGKSEVRLRDVVPNGPAHQVGLKDGDELLEVNGVPVVGLEPSRVLTLYLGRAHTAADLTVLRGDRLLKAWTKRDHPVGSEVGLPQQIAPIRDDLEQQIAGLISKGQNLKRDEQGKLAFDQAVPLASSQGNKTIQIVTLCCAGEHQVLIDKSDPRGRDQFLRSQKLAEQILDLTANPTEISVSCAPYLVKFSKELRSYFSDASLTAEALLKRAILLSQVGKPPDAKRFCGFLRARYKEWPDEDVEQGRDENLPKYLNELAMIYVLDGLTDKSSAVLEEALALNQTLFPSESTEVLDASLNVEETSRKGRNFHRALDVYEPVRPLLVGQESVASKEDFDWFFTSSPNYLSALMQEHLGHYQEALRCYELDLESKHILRNSKYNELPVTDWAGIARCEAGLGHLDRAEGLFRRCIESGRWDGIETRSDLALIELRLGKKNQGEELLKPIEEAILKGQGGFPSNSTHQLAGIFEEFGKSSTANVIILKDIGRLVTSMPYLVSGNRRLRSARILCEAELANLLCDDAWCTLRNTPFLIPSWPVNDQKIAADKFCTFGQPGWVFR